MVKHMGTQKTKAEKGDIKIPDPAIRVQILYKSDPTLHLFMMLVVSRNGESSLMLSIIIRTYRIYILWWGRAAAKQRRQLIDRSLYL